MGKDTEHVLRKRKIKMQNICQEHWPTQSVTCASRLILQQLLSK